MRIKSHGTGILLALALAGCSEQEGTWDCEREGVKPGSPMGPLVSITMLPDSAIEHTCGVKKLGCVKRLADGAVELYYRTGDSSTLRHELCHVMHGPYHTVGYTQEQVELYFQERNQ